MTLFNVRGRWAAAALVTAVAASVSSASDPCAGNCGAGHGLAGREKLKPTCDTRMYPKFDACYIRQFCGPQISPNACFGYYPTNWRSWDSACGTGYGCVTGVAVPVPVAPPMDPQPMPGGAEKPSDKKFPTALPSIPTAPAPAPRRDQSPVASFMSVGTVSVPSLRPYSSGIVQTSLIRSYAADTKR